MITASFSSVFSNVRSSLPRADDVSIGWTHERHASLPGQLTQHPPTMTGGLAHHRDTDEALRLGLPTRPVQRRAQVPGAAPEGLPRQHFRVVVRDYHHLLAVRQINA